METARPKDLGFLKDFAGLKVASLLEVQDRARLSALVDRYRYYTMGEIADVPFQNQAVKCALKPRTGTTALEIATGGGKTVIAAKIAREFIVAGGKAVYVCPNAVALGSEVSGIVQVFHRVFSHYKLSARIGQVNVPSKVNDVNFFTPMGLIGLRKMSQVLFDQLIDLSTVILLDEAHHFPEDAEGILKIFGEIPRIAHERFHNNGKKVVAFTATYGRLDGKTVVGKAPNFKFTVKNSVDEGRAPEVHGMQIYLPFQCPNARTIAADVDLALDEKDYASYWRLIAGYMAEIWKRRPVPLAAFVRLRSEAAYLVQLFNKASNLGAKGLAVLTSDLPVAERERVINAVKDGSLIGYVTCGVGVESIDIPRLEVIHLIQRTKSINKIVQAIGRALRPWKGKRSALVVDYQIMKESVINGCNGILLYAQGAGVDPGQVKKRANGSAIIAIDGASTTIVPDQATFGECEEWVTRALRLEEGHKGSLLRLAATGAVRPKDNSEGDWEGVSLRVLALAFYRIRNEKAKEYDPGFVSMLKQLPNLHQSWLAKRGDGMEDRKRELLRRAAAGEPKPSWTGPDNKLAFSLAYWTKETDPRYDPVFTEEIRKIRPEWLEKTIRKQRKSGSVFVQDDEPPPPPELPEDHWLKTGLYINCTQDRMYSPPKDHAQDLILKFAKDGGDFPNHFDDGDPDSYFIEKWTGVSRAHANDVIRRRRERGPEIIPPFVPVEIGAGKETPKDEIAVPMVWELRDLKEWTSQFTTRRMNGGGGGRRRYDSYFSWVVKLQKPFWDCLRSTFVYRNIAKSHIANEDGRGPYKDHGLTAFEILVKIREKEVFDSLMRGAEHETLVKEFERFYVNDGEFPFYDLEDCLRQLYPLTSETEIRLRDAQSSARPPKEEYGYMSRREMFIDKVYQALFHDLEKGIISADRWQLLDNTFQAMLMSHRKVAVPELLAPYRDLVDQAMDIDSIIAVNRWDIHGELRPSNELATIGISRDEAMKVLWLFRSNYYPAEAIESIAPGSSKDPKVLLRQTREVLDLKYSIQGDRSLENLINAALSGKPFPVGLTEKMDDDYNRNLELFLYDERIEWLRRMDRERSKHSGLAIEAAP